MDIDELTGRELDRAVAQELGILDANDYNRIVKHRELPDGSWKATEWRDLPPYSANIAAAWELDGAGWGWGFDEFVSSKNLPVLSVVVSPVYGIAEQSIVEFGIFPTKSAAYATARCRAWLKTRQAMKKK